MNLEVLLVGVVLAAACSLSGLFLTVRRSAMTADAISHAILPGLVAGYVMSGGPNVWAGALGSLFAALAAVWLVEKLAQRRVASDSALGLIFPTFFAFGVFIVSVWFSGAHIDADSILSGELAFVPLERVVFMGQDLGPFALMVSLGLLALNSLFLSLFWKELKQASFDPAHSEVQGFRPSLLYWLQMATAAVTTVGAFSGVGAVLAVSLMIAPSAAAALWNRRLESLVWVAVVISCVGAVLGISFASWTDLSFSGSIAVAFGLIYLISAFASPHRGLLAQALRRRREERRAAGDLLAMHLSTHMGTRSEGTENTYLHLVAELGWSSGFAALAISELRQRGFLETDGELLRLSVKGEAAAQRLRSEKLILGGEG